MQFVLQNYVNTSFQKLMGPYLSTCCALFVYAHLETQRGKQDIQYTLIIQSTSLANIRNLMPLRWIIFSSQVRVNRQHFSCNMPLWNTTNPCGQAMQRNTPSTSSSSKSPSCKITVQAVFCVCIGNQRFPARGAEKTAKELNPFLVPSPIITTKAWTGSGQLDLGGLYNVKFVQCTICTHHGLTERGEGL